MKPILTFTLVLSLSAFARAADFQEKSAHDLAQSAIESAKQNDATKSFTQIHAAAKLSATDPLVIDTAAKLVAWYDTRVYKSQFTPEAQKEIEATQLLLLARKDFTTAYKSAAQYYGDLATAQLPAQFAPPLTTETPTPSPTTIAQPPTGIPLQPPVTTIYTADPTTYSLGIPLTPFNSNARPPHHDHTTTLDNSPTSIHLDPIFLHSGTPQPIAPARGAILDNNPTSIHTDPFIHSPARNSNTDSSPTSLHTDPQFQHSK